MKEFSAGLGIGPSSGKAGARKHDRTFENTDTDIFYIIYRHPILHTSRRQYQPTEQPTEQPAKQPTEQPTEQSTEQPTEQPTEQL